MGGLQAWRRGHVERKPSNLQSLRNISQYVRRLQRGFF
jgi:hypothetical protein